MLVFINTNTSKKHKHTPYQTETCECNIITGVTVDVPAVQLLHCQRMNTSSLQREDEMLCCTTLARLIWNLVVKNTVTNLQELIFNNV